jgi:hypothetical protein
MMANVGPGEQSMYNSVPVATKSLGLNRVSAYQSIKSGCSDSVEANVRRSVRRASEASVAEAFRDAMARTSA